MNLALRVAGKGASTVGEFSYYLLRGLPLYTSLYGTLLSFQRKNPGRGTDALVRRLLDGLTIGDRLRILPIPGGKIRRPSENLVGIMVSIYEVFVQKEYEKYREYLPGPGDMVIDVGAYVGLWTIHVARMVGDGGRVLAVEPNPFVFSQLERNISLNRLTNVTLLRGALGDFRGQVDLFGEAKESSLASMFRDRVEVYTPRAEIAAMRSEITTIDRLLEENGTKRVDLLKIDAEGAELGILKGARKALNQGTVRRVVVEVHEDICSKQDVADFLVQNGFVVDHALSDPDPSFKKAFVFSRSCR